MLFSNMSSYFQSKFLYITTWIAANDIIRPSRLVLCPKQSSVSVVSKSALQQRAPITLKDKGNITL